MMSEFYLILVVVLFALAISDLIVGVSNDAVNFLNSAIGSKAAPKWVVFLVASLGIMIGCTFSSGMMEIARKGIFNPDLFVFSEIMVIFIAVMIADVILLDLFNTYGLPTSTTVSIVFDLIGASVAVSLVKINRLGESYSELSKYINTDKALAIIFGILVSVVIAFIVGSFVQWVTRFLFSFRYNKSLKYFGSLYGGIAISVMTYFMIIKGINGASFITPEILNYINNNMMTILLYSFIGWSLILQFLSWAFKLDVLKVIVLAGTFALAMAFAGNDLVNFIGVPLAGLESFKAWTAAGTPDVNSFFLTVLSQPVKTNTSLLVLSGAIMVLTMIFSRKAKTVLATTVDLSRQDEGQERFNSSSLARFVVRGAVDFNKVITRITPKSIVNFIEKRFERDDNEYSISATEQPAFDKLRAASNLVVASILISLGTSLKLPLSTTYVTFIVAMATSLADRAWGRESAVYRISGVFTVVGGWFLTAIIAFIVSFIVALIIISGGSIMIFVFLVIAVGLAIHSHSIFNKRSKKLAADEDEVVEGNINVEKVVEKCNRNTIKALISVSKTYFIGIESFINEDRSQLKTTLAEVSEFNLKAKKLKDSVYKNIQRLNQDSVETGHFYVQAMDYLREMAHSMNFIIEPLFVHLSNKHKPFNEEQEKIMSEFNIDINNFFNFALHVVKENQFEEIENLISARNLLLERIKEMEKAQIKRIKHNEVSTRNSVLFFNTISETKNLLLHTINLIKSQRDFIEHTNIKI